MKADSSTIWRVPAYLPYVQPNLSDTLIADAESRIGFRLPSEYLNLLRSQNGGYIRFCLRNRPHDVISGIGPHFPSLTDFSWDDVRDHVTRELDGLVPFDGDGHWHICLDYRKGCSSPCITYVDVELDSERKIADSFAGYLQLLVMDIGDNDHFIPAVADIEKMKSAIAKPLGITFEEPDSWSHGYPTYRARFFQKKDPEWIWIAPNLVPRGFVRESDSRYDELRHLMPGNALRYPTLPEKSFIVTFTDDVRSAVLQAFRDAGIEILPMKGALEP